MALAKPADVRCLVLDVDGVMTDGRLFYFEDKEPARAFHTHDGLAIKCFERLVGPVIVVTAKESRAVVTRAHELGIDDVIQGSRDKLIDTQAALQDLNMSLSQAAVIGDDLPDLAIMRHAAYPMAPANAAPEVREVARYVTTAVGGHGAVREAIEHLLRADGRWDDVVRQHAGEITTTSD